MAKKSQWVQIGKHKVELSNLDKTLFPDDLILKAEVIEYYLKIAPTLLQHIKGRALTLVRFPDGIAGEKFYQKNRPDWAPPWLEFVKLGKEERKDYIIATEPASLVWLANLAALEIHQLHSRKPNFDHPDYIVFDLDPPEDFCFPNVVPIAQALREVIESFGYTPFVKTTGGKGLHICCPIMPEWDYHTVFEAAQDIAKGFVADHKKLVTLHLEKEARKGRVLIDIFRIRIGQSIVSPYSLRGRTGAPVSMPLTWPELMLLHHPSVFNLHTVLDKVLRDGDAWAGFDAFAVDIHTKRRKLKGKSLPPSARHKSPDQLKAYERKRDFKKTPEPIARLIESSGNNFVVHRHHASHLHYDLRLEQDGVLKSWAVPKGLPPNPGVKRLAVQTEDHPLEYLQFDGVIPKGQYGAGEMWIYVAGKYQITKEKKDGFYFRLNSKELNGEYRIYKIKDKEWLLERVDQPQLDVLHVMPDVMLAEVASSPPVESDFIFEVKWDGIRALVALEEGKITIQTRNKSDITAQFPELQVGDKAFRAACGVFDAEIVCLDDEGKPTFKHVINRMMTTGPAAIITAMKRYPAVCYLFDCLYLDGRSLMQDPLLKRKSWLKDSWRAGTSFRISEHVDDGMGLWEAAKLHQLEGVMAKRSGSKYFPGKRSSNWLKIKVNKSTECYVIGYTKGKGDRIDTFGALQLAEKEQGQWVYRGKVGTGFDAATMKEIRKQLNKIPESKKVPLAGKITDGKVTTWLKPILQVEIRYSSITSDKLLREPVFLRLRLDLIE